MKYTTGGCSFTLQSKDVSRLDDGKELNDELINWYIKFQLFNDFHHIKIEFSCSTLIFIASTPRQFSMISKQWLDGQKNAIFSKILISSWFPFVESIGVLCRSTVVG